MRGLGRLLALPWRLIALAVQSLAPEQAAAMQPDPAGMGICSAAHEMGGGSHRPDPAKGHDHDCCAFACALTSHGGATRLQSRLQDRDQEACSPSGPAIRPFARTGRPHRPDDRLRRDRRGARRIHGQRLVQRTQTGPRAGAACHYNSRVRIREPPLQNRHRADVPGGAPQAMVRSEGQSGRGRTSAPSTGQTLAADELRLQPSLRRSGERPG
jgi:hypothetical protein